MTAASLALLLLLAPRRAAPCYIQGQDSGYCRDTSAGSLGEDMPFCAAYVGAYPSVCLPNEYDYFPNHTVAAKDRWVADVTTTAIARRQAIEEENGNGYTLRALMRA